MRQAARVDNNHKQIIETLRSLGATVQSTHAVGHGFPDAVVGFRGATYLAEIKDGQVTGWKFTPHQKRFMARWNGSPVLIFTCVDDVLIWARSKK